MGGKCVDTDEYLGPPLTHYIANYIGIAGPNHGAEICLNGGKFTGFEKACGKIDGMSCDSEFLKDINSKFVLFFLYKIL